MGKQKRKRRPIPIPYFRWNVSSLLPFGIALAGWVSFLEVEYTSHFPVKLFVITLMVGMWMLGAWFLWIRASAQVQVYPPDPHVRLDYQ